MVYNVGIISAHRPCPAHSSPSLGSRTSAPTQQENWFRAASAACVGPARRPEAPVQESGAAACVWRTSCCCYCCVSGSMPDCALASFPGFPPQPSQADAAVRSHGPFFRVCWVTVLTGIAWHTRFSVLRPRWEQSLGRLFCSLHTWAPGPSCAWSALPQGPRRPGILQLVL